MTISKINNQIIELEDKLKHLEAKLNLFSRSLTASQEKTKNMIQETFLQTPPHNEKTEDSSNL